MDETRRAIRTAHSASAEIPILTNAGWIRRRNRGSHIQKTAAAARQPRPLMDTAVAAPNRAARAPTSRLPNGPSPVNEIV